MQACRIGRALDSDIVLDDPEVSRRHAMIFFHGGHWWLSDMGSRNGVRVNGTRLAHAVCLRDGDEIRLGDQKLTFERAPDATPHADGFTSGPRGAATKLATDGPPPGDGADASLCGVVTCSPSGEILEGHREAERFFGGHLIRNRRGEPASVPDEVRQWLKPQVAKGTAGGLPLEMEVGNHTVTIVLTRQQARRCQLLLRVENALVVEARLLRLGCTAREAEVMRWVCRGKTNVEIAEILNVTVHTANRHLEHIYKKLGVENRHQAVKVVKEMMDPGR